MKIWTAIFQTECGDLSVQVFNNREGADQFIADCLKMYADVTPKQRAEITAENWAWCVNDLQPTGHQEIREQDVHPPETTGLDAIIAEHVPDLGEGDLEVDSNAVISMGEDPGAYVSCWKWVRFHEVQQPMAIIEDDGTVWYFDCFEEFMTVWHEEPNCNWVKGTDELLEKSDGPNDSWEYLTRHGK